MFNSIFVQVLSARTIRMWIWPRTTPRRSRDGSYLASRLLAHAIHLANPRIDTLHWGQRLTRDACPALPVNTKHLYNICTMLAQRRRRWTDVVQMLCKCFVFSGLFQHWVKVSDVGPALNCLLIGALLV